MADIIIKEKEMSSTITTNICATRARVVALGRTYRNTYDATQLVKTKDVVNYTETVYKDFSVGASSVENGDIPAAGGSRRAVATVSYQQATRTHYMDGSYVTGTYTAGTAVKIYGAYVTGTSLGTTATSRTKKGSSTPTGTVHGVSCTGTSIDVYQAANSVTWGNVTINNSTPVALSVKGQSYTLTASCSQTGTWTSGSTSSGTCTATYAVKAAVTGYSFNTSTHVITVTNNTTTSARNGYTITVSATGQGSKTASKDIVFNQAAGAKSYSAWQISTLSTTATSTSPVAAKGGNAMITVVCRHPYTWNGTGSTLYEYCNATLSTSKGTLAATSVAGNSGSTTLTLASKGTTISSLDYAVVTATCSSSTSVTKTVNVYQAANSLTWANPVITCTVPTTIAAKGGSYNIASYTTATQTGTYTSTSTTSATPTLSYAVTTALSGFSLSTSTVTATNNTSTTAKSGFVVTITATANNKSSTKAITFGQSAGAKSYSAWQISLKSTSYSVTAAKNTPTLTVTCQHPWTWNGTGTTSYDAGNATLTTTAGTLGATTLASGKTTTLTIASRGTTTGSAITITVKATCASDTTKTASITITQAANTLTWANPVITATSPVNFSAVNQSYDLSSKTSVKQTGTYSSGSTTSGTVTRTYKVATAATGFSLSSSTVSVTNNESTSTRGSFVVTITATGNSKSSSVNVTFTQSAGSIVYSAWQISTLTASATSIGASGGTSTLTVVCRRPYKWNNTGTQYYAYGNATLSKTDTGTTTTLSATTLTITSSSGATAKLTFPTKGTTASSTTNTTVKVTCASDTNITKSITVYQAANKIEKVTNPSGYTVSASDVPCTGGSVTSGTYSGTLSQSYVYTSGSSKTVNPDTPHAANSWSGGASNIASLGTTYKARTAVGSSLVYTYYGIRNKYTGTYASGKGTSSHFTIAAQSDGSYKYTMTYTGTGSNAWFSVQFPTFTFTAGKTYQYSIKIKCVSKGAGLYVYWGRRANDHNRSQVIDVSSDFVEYSGSNTLTATHTVNSTTYTTSPRLELYTASCATSGTVYTYEFYIKDVQVIEAPSYVAYGIGDNAKATASTTVYQVKNVITGVSSSAGVTISGYKNSSGTVCSSPLPATGDTYTPVFSAFARVTKLKFSTGSTVNASTTYGTFGNVTSYSLSFNMSGASVTSTTFTTGDNEGDARSGTLTIIPSTAPTFTLNSTYGGTKLTGTKVNTTAAITQLNCGYYYVLVRSTAGQTYALMEGSSGGFGTTPSQVNPYSEAILTTSGAVQQSYIACKHLASPVKTTYINYSGVEATTNTSGSPNLIAITSTFTGHMPSGDYVQVGDLNKNAVNYQHPATGYILFILPAKYTKIAVSTTSTTQATVAAATTGPITTITSTSLDSLYRLRYCTYASLTVIGTSSVKLNAYWGTTSDTVKFWAYNGSTWEDITGSDRGYATYTTIYRKAT